MSDQTKCATCGYIAWGEICTKCATPLPAPDPLLDEALVILDHALYIAKGEGYVERFDTLGVIRDRLTHPAPAARVTSEMVGAYLEARHGGYYSEMSEVERQVAWGDAVVLLTAALSRQEGDDAR